MADNISIDELVKDAGLATMSPADFDRLPFGSIRLDQALRVQVYNAAEATLAQRDSQTTIGTDFFRDVAPCTNNPKFRGRLDELIRSGKKSDRFDYRFLFPWGMRDVRIQLWVPDAQTRWIFVTPL